MRLRADLLQVLFAFGATGSNPADLNGDSVVDDADLLTVLFNFGAAHASNPAISTPLIRIFSCAGKFRRECWGRCFVGMPVCMEYYSTRSESVAYSVVSKAISCKLSPLGEVGYTITSVVP